MPEVQDNKVYSLNNFRDGECRIVEFYRKGPDGDYVDGTTVEEVLRVGIERLQDLNSFFPCRENSIAITKMQEALMWLNARTADRVARGVEGQHVA